MCSLVQTYRLPWLSTPVLVLGLILSYIVIRHAVRTQRNLMKARERGCGPTKRLPGYHVDFGLINFWQLLKASRDGTILDLAEQRFRATDATTLAVTNLGADIITTIDPRNVQSILAHDFQSWSMGEQRKRAFAPLLGKGIFTSDGKDWSHSRALLRPSFNRNRLLSESVFEHHLDSFIRSIPANGKTVVDLHPLFLRLTMDISTEFLFGKSTESLSCEAGEGSPGFTHAFERSQAAASAAVRTGILGRLLNLHDASNEIKLVHHFVDDIVKKRIALRNGHIKSTADDYIFLDELIDSSRDAIRIRSELLQILLAGRDTTASMLTNFWWCLSRHPEAYERLRQEVRALGDQVPAPQQVKDMKYLRAAINESLRLYPVVPVNLREAVADTTLPCGGGPDGQMPIFVPKGQVALWNLWTMHRRKDVYGPDAALFKPERWLGSLRPGWAFLPFSGGPRVCLGQRFALTEASYIIIRIIQRFGQIEGVDDGPWKERVTLTTVNATGCKVKVNAR